MPRLALLLSLALLACGESAPQIDEGPRLTVDLSGDGWQLWLDRNAAWEQDELLAPPVDLATVLLNPPTGGWSALDEGREVSVPATVEQYTWDELAAERGGDPPGCDTSGDFVGVSWWTREFEAPALGPETHAGPPHVALQFDAVRLRAEIFLNQQLVGYDAVGNTPFDVDVTGKLVPGTNVLAVRVTDPGGNFDWMDHDAHRWGEQTIPASHGFGGITGSVRLVVTSPVHIADVFVRNKSDPRAIQLDITVANPGPAPATAALRVEILDAGSGEALPVNAATLGHACPPGESVVSLSFPLPGSARLWTLEDPALHLARVELTTGPASLEGDRVVLGRVDDVFVRRFGLRSFTVEGVGEDAVFELNGERIVLRSAISWGFWQQSGMVPSDELARRQVESAKALGLNMLNHHRGLAAPGLLDVQDELGLLAYEEPGGYAAVGGDELCRAFAREKLLRMVRRDRSHPSLVIWNLINEETEPPTAAQRRDLADAHALDPTRLMTFTSGWAKEGADPLKLHARPGADELVEEGWCDVHEAPGPGCWRDEFWQGPAEFKKRTENRGEIVFWGEEGAIAAPPRLTELDGGGWDGTDYRQWREAYEAWLDGHPGFAPLEDILEGLGDVPLDYQARLLRLVRLGDVTDGYVVNGWECSKLENHSGIVDVARRPKGDPAILAAANAPTVLAVLLRRSVAHVSQQVVPGFDVPERITADIGLVDEMGLQGPHTLRLLAGGELVEETEVVLEAGPWGRILREGLELVLPSREGDFLVRAELRDAAGKLVAQAEDSAWLVDWRSVELPGKGAIIERSFVLRRFLQQGKGLELPVYIAELPQLDYVLVGDLDPFPREAVEGALISAEEPGVVEWQGEVIAPETGSYVLQLETAQKAELTVDGVKVISVDGQTSLVLGRSAPFAWDEGGRHQLALRYEAERGKGQARVTWTRPSMEAFTGKLLDDLLQRVERDGTTAVFVENADGWAERLAARGALDYEGRLSHGNYWLGGGFFAQEHELLLGLPPIDHRWEALIHYGTRRFGLRLSGDEAVVGCVTGHEHAMATALGIVEHGKGRIVLCSLDLVGALRSAPTGPGPADVPRRLLCNLLRYAGSR